MLPFSRSFQFWKVEPQLVLSLCILLFNSNIRICNAILPTAGIDVHTLNEDGSAAMDPVTFFASQASFGSYPPMKKNGNDLSPMIPIVPDASLNDPLLCNEADGIAHYEPMNVNDSDAKYVMLVPRGKCSFEQKALSAERLGASAIIIYGTLASRYSLNFSNATNYRYTSGDIIYPPEFLEYDCKKGTGLIPLSDLSFDPLPYNSVVNDPLLSGPSSPCLTNSDVDSCPSQKCLLTGEFFPDISNQQSILKAQACCAWDLHIWLFNDKSITQDVNIQAVYITMGQADELFEKMMASQSAGMSITLTLYQRWQPEYNISAVVIWALGVFVAAIAAYLSANDYRHAKNVLSKTINNNDVFITSPSEELQGENRDHTSRPYERVGYGSPGEMLELNLAHALGFIVVSTTGLLVLFFLKVYSIVKVMYALGCSNAIMIVMVLPFIQRISRTAGISDKVVFTTHIMELGEVTVFSILSFFISYSLGSWWLYLAFTQLHPDTITFFWVMQDIMGACMCIMFLSTIQLNSIKIATVLLIAAFFYDIFFVFVTPFLTEGGKSIMVDVATSGGPPKADPAWCEKYPSDKDCFGGDPMPMLLTIPRFFDYAGGSSLLGLGDIVLPGLLLSFACRYDEAKAFIGLQSGGAKRNVRSDVTCRDHGGYFLPLVFAYGTGLAMANIAVYVMQMGQPALLYLVPCCLGTISFLGWKRGELKDLWNTPRVLLAVENILEGQNQGTIGSTTIQDESMIESSLETEGFLGSSPHSMY